jgi:hypothetical protein
VIDVPGKLVGGWGVLLYATIGFSWVYQEKLLLFIWAYKEILSKLALTIGVDRRCRMRTSVFVGL